MSTESRTPLLAPTEQANEDQTVECRTAEPNCSTVDLSLSWRNINCRVLDPESPGKTRTFKQILHDVWGEVHAGELLAVMGPSGAGKTSLLNILAGRPSLGKDGSWSGAVLLNGVEPWPRWQRQMGYVMQRDIFFEELTVHETLYYTALLKLPYDWPQSQKQAALNQLVKQLGLGSVLNTKIGSQVERGLSGGEVKRVNIASELLGGPPLLVLDEPLTGLDSSRAAQVMTVLRDVAKVEQRTVLLTIHQPSSKMYEMFDKLMLMAPGGRTVFFGESARALEYFAALGHRCPQHWIPADFFIELVSDPPTAAALAEHFGGSSGLASSGRSPAAAQGGRLPARDLPFVYATWVLMQRGFKQAKGVYLKKLEWAMILFLALVWGGLWFGVGRHVRERMTDYIGIVFFFIAHWSWYSMFQGLGTFPAQRNVLTKERASEAYGVGSFFVAKVVCEIPIQMVLPLFFFAVCFPLVGFAWKTFIPLYLVTLLTVQVAAALSMLISVTLFDEKQASVVAIVFMVFQMCAGGYFINMDKLGWLGDVRYISYWYYALGLFFDVAVLPYGELARESTAQYSFSTFGIGWDSLVLLGVVFVTQFVSYLVLRNTKKLEFS